MLKMVSNRHWDKEVVKLCNALNEINGIRTFESCCGHGKKPFNVMFYASDMDKVCFVLSALNAMLQFGFMPWKCTVQVIDLRCHFNLISQSVGEDAYDEANAMADHLHRMTWYRKNHCELEPIQEDPDPIFKNYPPVD
jgi:hypothetical protein